MAHLALQGGFCMLLLLPVGWTKKMGSLKHPLVIAAGLAFVLLGIGAGNALRDRLAPHALPSVDSQRNAAAESKQAYAHPRSTQPAQGNQLPNALPNQPNCDKCSEYEKADLRQQRSMAGLGANRHKRFGLATIIGLAAYWHSGPRRACVPTSPLKRLPEWSVQSSLQPWKAACWHPPTPIAKSAPPSSLASRTTANRSPFSRQVTPVLLFKLIPGRLSRSRLARMTRQVA